MHTFYTEDRSAGKTGADASPKVLNALDLVYLTDWTAEDFDKVLQLGVSEEVILDNWLYVKRLV